MNNAERVKRIVQKLKEVRNKGLLSFGSEKHQFELNKPLTEHEIAEFEQKHNVTLPDDYRAFLRYAGNGGAGPYYGVYKLEYFDYFADWVIDNIPDDYLSRTNKFRPGRNEISEELSDNDVVYEQQLINLYQGTLSIGTQGCTYEMVLVVTGEYKGRVVYVDADNSLAYMCRARDFLEWYERWLDEMLGGYNNVGWFGYGPGGGANDFFSIIETSNDAEEIKEAFRAFSRLPQLDEQMVNKLLPYIPSDKDYIKEGISSIARACDLPCSEEQIEAWLNDESANVRLNAIWLAEQRNLKKFRNQLYNIILTDKNQDVIERAYLTLSSSEKNTGVDLSLTHNEVLQLLQSKQEGIHHWASDTDKWTEDDADLLISLLSDRNSMVRTNAVRNLDKLKIKKSVSHILAFLEKERTKDAAEKEYDDCYSTDSAMKLLGRMGDETCVPELLLWAEHKTDDFYRINALKAIVQIGDERIIPIAKKMLKEDKKPERKDLNGFKSMSHVKPIKKLVKDELKKSSNPKIKKLAGWNLFS